MNDKNAMSITSNDVKLFKHLDSLQALQNGQSSPVMLHISPTNLCNMKCSHCCFFGRNRTQNLSLDIIQAAVDSFSKYGLKSLELTGGGEPTLYPEMGALMEWLKETGWPVGMNTNALSIHNVPTWDAFRWVRVSLNILNVESDADDFLRNVRFIQDTGTRVTACYIVSKDYTDESIERVLRFADTERIPTRLAPDCIQKKPDIAKLIQRLEDSFGNDLCESEFVFLSSFNVYLEDRQDDRCYLHLLKPFLYTDGWIYDCPSSELSYENNRTMKPKFRVCKWDQIHDHYKWPPKPRHQTCHYCKYAEQNRILRAVLERTQDNEFC